MQRPILDDYLGFIEGMKENLARHSDVCFYTFGTSPGSQGHIVGRSDIDGGLIVNSPVVMPREILIDLSGILAKSLIKCRVGCDDINLIDTKTNRDGRFLSYTTDFTDWLKEKAIIHSGPDFVQDMNGWDYKSGNLDRAAFNFRAVNNGFLHSIDDMYNNPGKFMANVEKALDIFAKMPKKLLWLTGREVIANRMEAERELANLLPGCQLEHLRYVNHLLDTPQALDAELENSDSAYQLYLTTIIALQEMIKAYINLFPSISLREIKL